MMNLILIISLIFCVVSLNILWYVIKDMLKKRGYRVHYFYNHLSDIYNLSRLIENEQDFALKKKYKRLKSVWVILLILFFTLVATLFLRFEVFRLFTI